MSKSLLEVHDRSGDPRGGMGRVRRTSGDLGRVERPSGRSETSQKTLGEFWDGWGTLGEVWDGLKTLGEVQDGSGDPRGDLEIVIGPSESSGMGWGFSGRFGTGRQTRAEV